MRLLFNMDSPLMQFLSKVADLMIINFLWMLCCIPIFTIGAATTAMYRFCMEMALKKEPVHPVQHFFQTFRAEFKCATSVHLILMIPAAMIGINLWLLVAEQLNQLSLILFACLIPMVILMAVLCYVYAYAAFFEDTPLTCIKNAFILSLAYFPKTVCMLLLTLSPAGLYLLSPAAFSKVLIYWLVIGFSATAYLNGHILSRIFKGYMGEEPAGA